MDIIDIGGRDLGSEARDRLIGMKLQHQTLFGGPKSPPEEQGNCWSTCLASLIGVDLAEVPNFCALYPDSWLEKANEWLDEHFGCSVISFYGPMGPFDRDSEGLYWNVYVIASGRSPRGDWNHSVIWKNRKMFHDPHPSGAGLVGPPSEWEVLTVTNVMRWKERIAKTVIANAKAFAAQHGRVADVADWDDLL
jgi:hypothetical protein